MQVRQSRQSPNADPFSLYADLSRYEAAIDHSLLLHSISSSYTPRDLCGHELNRTIHNIQPTISQSMRISDKRQMCKCLIPKVNFSPDTCLISGRYSGPRSPAYSTVRVGMSLFCDLTAPHPSYR